MKSMKSLIASIACITLAACSGCTTLTPKDDTIDVEKFQPSITTNVLPPNPHKWYVYEGMQKVGINSFQPQVESYNKKGNLFASWNPSNNVSENISIIIIHGGHGIGPTDIDTAKWFKTEFNANVLILDSYWSRGKLENWSTANEYGANMRVLDVLAAAKFLKSKGSDPQKTFVIGNSQGGWTVLRTFTDNTLTQETTSLLKGGFALYPNCYDYKRGEYANNRFIPKLGPYHSPIMIFTGGRDTGTPISQCSETDTLKSAYKWTHFPDATHAWDTSNRGVGNSPVDGECDKALNIYNKFGICRNNAAVNTVKTEIKNYFNTFVPKKAVIKEEKIPTKLINGKTEAEIDELLRNMTSK